jgi:iron complex outermembrane receptor protein
MLPAPPDVPPTLEEIVVTADRQGSFSADFVQAGSFRGARQLDTPLTVNIVPATLIRSQQAQGLLDALRNAAGVNPSQTAPTVYSNITIRGIDVENRTNYRLNGVLPIVNLIDLPLEDKDRVEVLKGASALYYGLTTPGGIVNLTMKRPTLAPHLAATVFGNGFGAVGGHIDAGNTWDRFGARVNAVYGSVDPGIDHTRGQRSLLAAAVDFKPSDSVTLTLDAEHIFKRVTEPGIFRYNRIPPSTPANLYPALGLPPLLDPTRNFGPDWASNRAEETNVLAAVQWRITPAWTLSASYGNSHLVRDRHSNTLDLDEYGPDTDGDGLLTIRLQHGGTFENANYRAEIAGALHLGFMEHELLVGATQNVRDGFTANAVPATCPGATPTAPRVTCKQNIFHPLDIPYSPFPARTGIRTRIEDSGYYLFDRIEMTAWLQVLAGVRKVDYNERNLDTGAITFADQPTTFSYGAVFKPRAWMSLYGTYIEGLEPTPPAPLTANNVGTGLPATESTQLEAGIKIEARAGLLVQAAWFEIERSSSFVNAANVYVLDGRARFRGTEFSVTGEVTPDWSVYVTAQLLDAKQISGAPTQITTDQGTGVVTVVPTVVGRAIENTAERTLSLATEYRLTSLLPGFGLNGAAYYVSERAVNSLNQAFIPGYTLFDLGASWTGTFDRNELTVRLTGQNIADRKYFASTGLSQIAQGPPRVLKLSITTRF